MSEKILLVESIQLKKTKELSELCHQCKNLYNLGLYYINNYYEIMEIYLNWYDTKWMLKESVPFKKLPAQVAQNVLKMLHKNCKSFFNNKQNKKKSFPKFLKKDGEFIACFNHQHIPQKKQLSKNKQKRMLHFPKKTNLEPIEIETSFPELQQIRIIPKNDIYNLEIIYNHISIQDLKLNKNRMIAIDIGVNNLACIVNNIGLQPISINGRPLKSINQFYNKKSAEYQSISKKENEKWDTRRLQKLRRIRNLKVKDYIHKTTRIIIDYCIENNIGTMIIGKNKGWKQNIDLGKVNNQKFVQIPFDILISQLQYKADLIGIDVKIITEEYTSLCSFLDNEPIKKHEKYKGKRIKRGLFRVSDGRLINADVNGAYNIMKKAFPKDFNSDGIEGVQLHPLLINLNTKSKLVSIKSS